MSETRPAKVKIDAELVARLVAAQFPRWAGLPVTPVANGGWNNVTFHLGEAMSVRLPRAAAYVAQVEKEQAWLPRLAPALPLPIPTPLAAGQPGDGYPWPWSVYGWLPGETASDARIADMENFARDLAGFLTALQGVDTAGGPAAGAHNFFRGGPLSTYEAQTREAISRLEGQIDTGLATQVWESALAADWRGPPVWVHGDVAAGNLLVVEGRLSAVIDFGILGVGDPACDLAIAWTLMDAAARAVFRAALSLDAGTWARGRGWVLWKAAIVASGVVNAHPDEAAISGQVLAEVMADHQRGA